MSLIGHRFADGPRVPTLFVLPTQQMAGSMSAERVARLLRDCPALDELHAKGKSNSKFEKWVAGVPLRFGWAGSATTLAAHPCGLVLIDELDRMGRDTAGEGDPVTLAKARTKNYPQPLVVCTSSPTIEDASPIQSLFDQGSREIWEWMCPHCEQYHRPLSMHLKWPDGATPDQAEMEALYGCPHCGGLISEEDRGPMIASGRFAVYLRNADGEYEPTGAPVSDYRHRSFWISGFGSPWVSFGTMARELCQAYRTREPENVQATLNTYTGELWKVRGDAPDWSEVASHRSAYERGTLPHGVQVVTLGADVQHDRIYYVVRGWGHQGGPMESWLIDYGELLGRTDMDDVYVSLTSVLRKHEFQIKRALIDSGYKPQIDYFKRPDHQIYLYCRQHMPQIFPSKGYDGRNKPVEPSPIDVGVGGVTIKNGVILYRVDVSYFKSWLYSRVRPAGEGAPDLWHLPREVDEDYMRQVVAEELITKPSGHMIWRCPPTRPNHYLDCEVLATAAAYSLNLYTLNPLPEVREGQPAQAAPVRRGAGRFQRRGL
jgi:phage terminase large subunit GpA-like protein